jgi:hypothetical protein
VPAATLGRQRSALAASALSRHWRFGRVLGRRLGSQSVNLSLSGNYTQSAWNLSKDAGTETLVVDPTESRSHSSELFESPSVVDLLNGIGAHGTLSYQADALNILGPNLAVTEDTMPDPARLRQYDAAGFSSITENPAGKLILDPSRSQASWRTPSHWWIGRLIARGQYSTQR